MWSTIWGYLVSFLKVLGLAFTVIAEYHKFKVMREKLKEKFSTIKKDAKVEAEKDHEKLAKKGPGAVSDDTNSMLE